MKNVVVLSTIAITMLSLVSIVMAPDASVDGSVTILSTCGITATPNTITFTKNQQPIVTGETSDVSSTDIYNQGSVAAPIDVSGIDWTYGTGTVTNTKFGDTNSPATSLQTYGQQIFASLGPGSTSTAYFAVTIPYGTPAGTYSQTITFTSSCNI